MKPAFCYSLLLGGLKKAGWFPVLCSSLPMLDNASICNLDTGVPRFKSYHYPSDNEQSLPRFLFSLVLSKRKKKGGQQHQIYRTRNYENKHMPASRALKHGGLFWFCFVIFIAGIEVQKSIGLLYNKYILSSYYGLGDGGDRCQNRSQGLWPPGARNAMKRNVTQTNR